MSDFVYTVRGYSTNGRKNVSATIAVLDANEHLVFEDTVKLSAAKDRLRFAEAIHHIVGEDDIEEKLLRLLEKLPDSPPEKEEKPRLTARFPGLIDIVEYDGEPHFLLVEDGELRAKDFHEGQRPPGREHFPYLLPRYEQVNVAWQTDNDAQLFEDLVQYHRGISFLPNDDLYVLLAAFSAHTHLMERWQQSPILVLFATPERGKSRTGKGIIYVSRRGVHTETVNEANLFRWSHDLDAVLFLDVHDLWRKIVKRGADDILLQRFEQGATTSRVLWPERGPFNDTRYFDIYGATIVATNWPIQNVLETRCLTIVMPDAETDYPGDVLPEKGLPLRERLIAFRARHLDRELPYIDKPCGGRLGEILRTIGTVINLMAPGYTIAPKNKTTLASDDRTSFDRLVETFVSSRQKEKADTPEASILETMIGLEHEVVNNKLAVSVIAAKMNEGLPEKQQRSSKSIGYRLKALGFEGARTNKARAYIYDEKKLFHLAVKYGVASPDLLSSLSSPLDTKQIGDNKGDNVGDGGNVGDDLQHKLSLSEPDTEKGEVTTVTTENTPSPLRKLAEAEVLALAESLGWPADVLYQDSSGESHSLHLGRPDHWKEWIMKAPPDTLAAVKRALEAYE